MFKFQLSIISIKDTVYKSCNFFYIYNTQNRIQKYHSQFNAHDRTYTWGTEVETSNDRSLALPWSQKIFQIFIIMHFSPTRYAVVAWM
jgi:hypothetical protein